MAVREPVAMMEQEAAARIPPPMRMSSEEIEAGPGLKREAEQRRQLGSPRSCAHADYIKHADFLSRSLATCWRNFFKTQKTTLALVQAYDALGINENSVKLMSFEKLAMSMEAPAALEATKALLDRLEKWLILSQSTNIDHLLKRLVSPKRKAPQSRTRVAARSSGASSRSSRYPLRVVLCAYMVLAHPGVVLSGQGEQEKLLMESAANFVREFELLVKTVLEGPGGGQSKFMTRLVNFDKAWCTYLYHFVVWKVKDARSMEGDLVRAACKLELSMMQTCRLTADGQSQNLTDDMKAIQKQVTDDQDLLREKVQQLSGDVGIDRMNSALSDARSKFFQAKENGSPLATPVANVSAPLSINPSGQLPPASTDAEGSSSTSPVSLPTENEQMANEMLHRNGGAFAAKSDDGASTTEKDLQARVRATMEKAFWDVVTDSMKGDKPDYCQLINLVKEVRDSLHDLAPKDWKEEISGNIDIGILTQVLGSGSQDTQYLGQILHYSLDMVRKLSAAAKEDEMKRSHDKLLSELSASSEANGNGVSSFVIAVIKGLRFTLQKAFSDRYGPPASASASLPVTLQWVSTSKNMLDAEWSEHLGSLSVL